MGMCKVRLQTNSATINITTELVYFSSSHFYLVKNNEIVNSVNTLCELKKIDLT